MEDLTQPIEKVNNWIKNSVTLKLVTITILMLLLLIPASMVTSIISERETLNQLTTQEVNSKWAGSQKIVGPVLTIPVEYEYTEKEKLYQYIKNYYILPNTLGVNGNIEPRKLKRGIYEVVVYESKLNLKGDFAIEKNIETQNFKRIAYEKAFLTIGISDLRGIKDHVTLNWNEEILKVKPGSRIQDVIKSGVTIDLPMLADDSSSNTFNLSIDLQGSENLSFIPVGNTTDVNLQSTWDSPSFNGNFLPDSREVDDKGFKANWKILQLNRNFPQTWMGNIDMGSFNETDFGVNLILPLDDYQKSMRSAKYAVMTIALTFLIFFMVEILNKRKIHPFQYTLVGLALCLFYILLLSISEHSNFNLAYLISTIAVVGMIGLYSISVFKMKRITVILLTTLIGIYSFLFVTLQLADYALLMGSIGLALILGATMYFTRNINWYKLNIAAE